MWGVNVSAPPKPVSPYGTYIPVYGGEGGGRYADCPALPLWKTFIHSIIEQPYIALCSLAIRLGIKLSLAYPYGQPFYPQHIHSAIHRLACQEYVKTKDALAVGKVINFPLERS